MKIPSVRAKPVSILGEVARQIRQHARSSISEEICGVLIGTDDAGSTSVTASIAGAEAAQAGTHVTFTQNTWEHIYRIKDRDFPEERIVGWYHSHPGFGVFLSEHDTFIHKNFFASPHQLAWVFDPHSDEEGCFGWQEGRLERLGQFAIVDGRGGEPAGEPCEPEKVLTTVSGDAFPAESRVPVQDDETGKGSLEGLALRIFSLLGAALAGFAVAWFLFPQVLIMPVPFDAQTGKPLPGFHWPVSSIAPPHAHEQR